MTADNQTMRESPGEDRRAEPHAMTLVSQLGALLVVSVSVLGVAVPVAGQPIAYVTDHSVKGRVWVVDTATESVLTTIAVGSGPRGVAATPDGAKIYVANHNPVGTVSVIDTVSNTVTATVPVGAFPDDVAITPDGRRAYVSVEGDQKVSVIDIGTDTILTDVSMSEGPRGLAVTPDGSEVWVTVPFSQTVSIIDTASTSVVDVISIGGPNSLPAGVAFTPDGGRAYVTRQSFQSVRVIDTATRATVADVPLGFDPLMVAITPDGTRAYLPSFSLDAVAVVDTSSHTVLGMVPVGTSPTGLDFTADGSRAYVATELPGSLSVIDTATETNIGTVRLDERRGEAYEVVLVNSRTLQIQVDIKPGSEPNSVNVRSEGLIPVAVLTTRAEEGDPTDFDAWDLDASTVRFGPLGAGIAHSTGHAEDVDGDGDLDRVLHFRAPETGLTCDDNRAVLTGATLGGQPVEGVDAVRPVGCQGKPGES